MGKPLQEERPPTTLVAAQRSVVFPKFSLILIVLCALLKLLSALGSLRLTYSRKLCQCEQQTTMVSIFSVWQSSDSVDAPNCGKSLRLAKWHTSQMTRINCSTNRQGCRALGIIPGYFPLIGHSAAQLLDNTVVHEVPPLRLMIDPMPSQWHSTHLYQFVYIGRRR